MKTTVFKVIAREKQTVIGTHIVKANSIIDRMTGLMFKKSLDDIDGIILSPCNSIHTFFMRFSIHAIFLDKSNKIIKIYKDLKPWRITPIFFNVKQVLEIDAQKDISTLKEGDHIEVICSN